MCGLTGIVHYDGSAVDPDILLRMRETLLHRGPDDAGLWTGDGAGLAHRRLSIFDLSPLGHQPMASPDGSALLVFNGEIFNFLELRRTLESEGQAFTSTSDTEVLLRDWQRRGAQCLQDLIGMYGFAIWDRRTRSLFAARDRAGIKPFYYAEIPGGFIFASEIKALLAHPACRPRLDHAGFADYHFAGYALGDRTLFEGIRQLPPGHLLTVRDGRVETAPYWQVNYRYVHGRNHADTAAELRGLMEDAVRLHCRSDAPLGSHLSGGLDSSTVATLASAFHRPLSTFGIRFPAGGAYDESAYAREVAAMIESDHHEDAPGDVEVRELLPFLIWHMDFPMRAGGVGYFAGARLARRFVTVSLTGHGGDEVFGGYPAQFEVGMGGGGLPSAMAATAPHRSAAARIATLLRTEGVRGVLDRAARRARPVAPTAADRWITLHCTRPEPADNPRLALGFRRALSGYSPVTAFLKDFEQAPTDEPFDRCLHHDLRTYLPSLLHVEDRASMAVALESRVPMLDHRLIEFLATVPPAIKAPSRQSKELLRTVMRDRLPERLLARPDKGAFPVPIDSWMRGSLRDFTHEILRDPRTLDRGIFSPDWLRRVADERVPEETWTVLSLELWARLFLDEDATLLASVQQTGRGLRSSLGLPQ